MCFPSRDDRIQLFRIDLQIEDGLLNNAEFNLLFPEERDKCRQRDETCINLEEISKGGTAVAASEPIGSQGMKCPWKPARDGIRERANIVRRGDKHSSCAADALTDVRNPGLLFGMEQIPAFRLNGVPVKFLVAGDAPDVCGDLVFVCQQFLRV